MARISDAEDWPGVERRATARSALQSVEITTLIVDTGMLVKLEPKGAEGHSPLGYFHDVAGEDERAMGEYHRALALDPGDAHAKAALGRLVARREGRGQTDVRDDGGALYRG